jgi:hypothetical protein
VYSETKVRERIAIAEAELLLSEKRPVTLEYHTVEEINLFERYLLDNSMYVVDERGTPTGTQNLSDFARRWMLNEQALCLSDALYCVTRYGYVKDDKNVIYRFAPRVSQRIMFDIISELQDADASLEIIILKARQLGMSTLIELLIGHRIIFSYGVNAVIGSADNDMTGRMSQMLFLFYDKLPLWLKPKWTRRAESSKGLLEFGDLSSGVSFQHGAQKHGIGTGSTPTLYHLSEVALYEATGGREKIVDLIEVGLWNAVHPSPMVFGVLETTGRGDQGWFPDKWNHSRQFWIQGKARMRPVFLPWFCGVNIYPTDTEVKTRPIPPDWRPNPDTVEHIAKCELYAKSEQILFAEGKERFISDYLVEEQHSGRVPWNTPHPDGNWHMPRMQQWWWEYKHEEAKASGTVGKHYQELAADDREALQRSGGEPVFGHETMNEIESTRARGYNVYGISGQSIESAHEPLTEYINYRKERIPIRYRSPKGETYKWELIPMLYGGEGSDLPELDPDSQDAPMGLLVEYEPPTPFVSYSIGVDTSEGRGEDSTVIEVYACGWEQSPDRQVAEFSSPYVSHTEAFSFILAIAAYYGQHMRIGETKWKEPYVSIEQVRAVGDVAQAQMLRMGYRNFHRFTRYDVRNLVRLKRISNKMGWFTFGWSRDILLGCFVHWAKNNWAEIHSPWLIYEMRHFEVNTTGAGKVKMEHEDGEHDDRIFASAMAIFCPHDMDRMDQRSKKRPPEDVYAKKIDISEYRGNEIPTRMKDNPVMTLADLLYTKPNVR